MEHTNTYCITNHGLEGMYRVHLTVCPLSNGKLEVKSRSHTIYVLPIYLAVQAKHVIAVEDRSKRKGSKYL